jgi:hypothetical protein
LREKRTKNKLCGELATRAQNCNKNCPNEAVRAVAPWCDQRVCGVSFFVAKKAFFCYFFAASGKKVDKKKWFITVFWKICVMAFIAAG